MGGESKADTPFVNPVVKPVTNPAGRYYTTPEALHAQLPGAAVHFLDKLGYYAYRPGQKNPQTKRAIALAKAKATRKAQANPTGAGSFYPGSMQTQARNIVNASINASLAGLRGPIKAEQAQAREQAARAQTYMKALGDLSANDPEEIQNAYMRAAGALKGWGTGLTGAVAAAQTQAGDETAAKMSELTGGLGTSSAAVAPADARSALQMTNVVIPGKNLVEEGASEFANAEARQYIGKLGVEQIAQDYLRRGTDLQKSLAQKASDLIATRPDLYQKALAGLMGAQQQQRALDVQIGTLQLQQAKTEYEKAVGMTNLTGHLYVVNNKGVAVDTGKPAPGSDAAQIATTAATTRAGFAAANARAAADRRVRQEIAKTRAAATVTAAATRAEATKTAAQTRAAATKAAAQIRADAANDPNKPATPKQRSDIIKNTNAQGGQAVTTRMASIWSKMPVSLKADQQPGESLQAYGDRHKKALKLYSARLRKYRTEIVSTVQSLITPQLKLLKYGPGQINGMAEAIVSAYIPQSPPTGWVGTIR